MFHFTENNYNNFQFIYQVGLKKHEAFKGKLTKIRLKYIHITNMELEKKCKYLLNTFQYLFKLDSLDIIPAVSSNFEEIIFLTAHFYFHITNLS